MVNTKSSHPYYQLIRSGFYSMIDYTCIPFPGQDNKTMFLPPLIWDGRNADFELQDIKEEENCIELNLIWKK